MTEKHDHEKLNKKALDEAAESFDTDTDTLTDDSSPEAMLGEIEAEDKLDS